MTSFLHVVTLIDDESSYGGPTTVALGQCRELIRQGHRAEIAAGWRGAGEPPTRLEGVPVHLFPVHRAVPVGRFSGLLAPALITWLRRHVSKFDRAHLHLARDLVPLTAARVLASAGVPYVTQTHGMVMPDARRSAVATDRFLTLPVLRGATHRLVLTDAEEAGLTELLGTTYPLTRLPNGIEVQPVAPAEPDVPDVLFLARLHPRKRVLDFAGAASILIEEGLRATFSVVGPDDGDLAGLRALTASSPRLAAAIRYEGALNHEAAVRRMANCSVYVLPSVDEPFPMTLLEALALGRPAICTDSCGIAPALAAREAAVVVSPGARNVADALRPLLHDRAARARLGARAAAVAKDSFSISAVVGELLTLASGTPVTSSTRL